MNTLGVSDGKLSKRQFKTVKLKQLITILFVRITKRKLMMKNIIKRILKLLEQLLPNQKDFFMKVRHSFTYDLLSYRDLLDEVLSCKPIELYESASVIKAEMSNKLILKIVYLDSKNEPVKKSNGNIYGFCLFAKDLDDEIKEIFGDKKIIILK